MNISEFLINKAENSPNQPAIIFAEQSISFLQLKNQVFCLANGLKELGVKKDVKVVVYLPNNPEYILGYLAVYCLGGMLVPLDFMLIQEELENVINHCEAKILIAKEKKDIDFKKIKQNSTLEKIILLDQNTEFINFHNLIDENSPIRPKVEISDSDYSTIFYTSGSTGHPKGVLLNYRHLDNPVKSIEYFMTLSSQDAILCPIPLSHAAGWVFFLCMLAFGTKLVLQERFSPLESLRQIERHKISFICLVPSMYIAMVGLKEFKKSELGNLKYVIVFGAPSSPILLRRFHQVCPNAYLLNGWGMTETSPPNAVLPLDSSKIESVGKLTPWIESKIVDEENKQVPVGEVGELAIRGWPIMEGYYKEPELTSKVMKNGWFYTGDLAYMDVEGFLYIVGRKKEMIKVAGERVHAPEIEEVIHRHPKVGEVAVVGVADKLRGEVPKAFIVLKRGNKLTDDELRYFCREHLAHFKIPHYFEFRDSLPKTYSGKIEKANLY
jgi:acyl-CoA synthetase (AMP-forming)/AMP-acid ligase II